MNKIVEIEKVKFTIEGHSDSVDAIALTPDGKTVIAGSGDGTIKVWDLETGEIEFTLEGHNNSVNAIAVTPDGKTVISGS
ncbi:MAG: WD40 repeat domain-containing protein, partial [Dolichospermum sp.]